MLSVPNFETVDPNVMLRYINAVLNTFMVKRHTYSQIARLWSGFRLTSVQVGIYLFM